MTELLSLTSKSYSLEFERDLKPVLVATNCQILEINIDQEDWDMITTGLNFTIFVFFSRSKWKTEYHRVNAEVVEHCWNGLEGNGKSYEATWSEPCVGAAVTWPQGYAGPSVTHRCWRQPFSMKINQGQRRVRSKLHNGSSRMGLTKSRQRRK